MKRETANSKNVNKHVKITQPVLIVLLNPNLAFVNRGSYVICILENVFLWENVQNVSINVSCSYFLFCFAILILVCGVHEEWTNCSDKFCRPTCQNMDKPLACKIKCEPGCSCKKGFIWNEDTQTCIPKNLCPKRKS